MLPERTQAADWADARVGAAVLAASLNSGAVSALLADRLVIQLQAVWKLQVKPGNVVDAAFAGSARHLTLTRLYCQLSCKTQVEIQHQAVVLVGEGQRGRQRQLDAMEGNHSGALRILCHGDLVTRRGNTSALPEATSHTQLQQISAIEHRSASLQCNITLTRDLCHTQVTCVQA